MIIYLVAYLFIQNNLGNRIPGRETIFVNLIIVIEYVIPNVERACCSHLVGEYLAGDL